MAENVIEDLVITEDELYTNNTFSLRALNDTLEKLSVTNFWSLYQTQRSRLKMERFDIPFKDFLATKRLVGEQQRSFYPRRYIAYINFTFIDSALRKKFRNSSFYNTAINQDTISNNPDLFVFNYLVFINGELIYTTEVYPVESKLGIIIDLENKNNEHGISLSQYNEYRDSNPTVTIIIVPNYRMINTVTNSYALDNLNYTIDFNRIPNSEIFNNNTICFVNTVNGIARRYYEDRITINKDINKILVGKNITPGEGKYRFCFITFNMLNSINIVTGENPYFKVNSKMPCPTEQMVVFIKDNNGRFLFKDNKVTLFYPNIYKVEGLDEGETAKIIVFQDEEELTDNEKYINELSKYEEYVDMLPKYKDGSIPEIIKNYKPSSFVYSIGDYSNSMYVPNTLNYKVQKLHKTIYENPWALAVYLDLLNLPTDKFYLDMSKIDLSIRLRYNSSMEVLDETIEDIEFEDDMYVFAMNRHFVNTRAYGFRVFIDGYFQLENSYTILPGPNYYYIYLPANKINDNSVIEIERYKLFEFETSGKTNSLDIPIVELNINPKNTVCYSREIYAVEANTSWYLNKDKDIRIEVLYKFAEGGEKWITAPSNRNIPIENKIRVYLLNEQYIGKTIKIGVCRTMAMHTGEEYDSSVQTGRNFTIFNYEEVSIHNQSNYDLGNYRMFNNGKLMLPIQYFVTISRYQGGKDIIRTSCDLYDGDRFTIDRTPGCSTVIYYQNEIDKEDKKGYVDLDGKIPLPLSLKWYDFYLNGVKLHKKNVDILSPTKMYIQGVDSRKHFVVIMRNRDPEIFKLASHDKNDKKDYNNTIIDDLMEEIGGLRNIINNTKYEIDPSNETHQIANNVVANQAALIFFFEYFVYTFINANHKQITQQIKDTFPSLINEQGIMEIDPNVGCVYDDSIAGYLIKLIECNYTNGRSEDMFTDKSVNYDGLGVLQDRFAIRPLDTTNYEYALEQEFMCDPETGEPAIMNEDGTVTSISTLFRTKNFIESFSEKIMMYGLGKADIYQITFDDEYKVHVYQQNENIITENIKTPKGIRQFAIGLDVTFLTKVGDSKMLKIADTDPIVEITYMDGNSLKKVNHSINRLHNYVIETGGKVVTLTSIKINGIDEGVKTFVHSLLIAF